MFSNTTERFFLKLKNKYFVISNHNWKKTLVIKNDFYKTRIVLCLEVYEQFLKNSD